MKRRIFALTILIMCSSVVWGQSYFSPLTGDLPEIGDARTMAIGFSGWGSAGRASALLHNSALLGLTDQKLSLIAGINGLSVKEKRSFTVQDSYGDFLADNTYVLNKYWFPDFHMGINARLLSGLRVSMLFNHANVQDFQYEEEVRGSLYGEYNRDPLVGYNRLASRYSTYNTSAGFSVNLFKSLWLGSAVNIMTPDFSEQTWEIQVLEKSIYLASDHSISYKSEPKFETAVTGNVGLIYDITRHLSVAASYRFPYETTQKGGLLYLISDSTQSLPIIAVDSNFTVTKVTRRQPGELRIGLCLKPVNIIPTQLFFELVYQDWKNASAKYQFKSDADLSAVPVDFYEAAIPYRNVMKVHVGIEHVFFSGVPFRAGFYHDPSPIDAGMDRNWFTAGTGYRWDNLSLEISGAFTNNEYEYHDLFPIVSEARIEFDTVRESYLVGMLTLKYNF